MALAAPERGRAKARWWAIRGRYTAFGNRDVGSRFWEMLALGRSRPWQDALELFTGSRRLDAGALLRYFTPLHAWLKEQNRGDPVGWTRPA